MILKAALLLSLLAGCYAAPIRTSKAASLPRPATGSLGRRVPGTLPASVDCAGQNIFRERIEAALIASQDPGISQSGKEYPTRFDNLNRGVPILKHQDAINAASSDNLEEHPLGSLKTWRTGDLHTAGANLYRVIFDKTKPRSNPGAAYVGVVYHRKGHMVECTEIGPSQSSNPPPNSNVPPSTPPKNSSHKDSPPKNSASKDSPPKDSGSKITTPKPAAPMPDLPDPERPNKGPPGVRPKKGGKPKGGKSKNGGGA